MATKKETLVWQDRGRRPKDASDPPIMEDGEFHEHLWQAFKRCYTAARWDALMESIQNASLLHLVDLQHTAKDLAFVACRWTKKSPYGRFCRQSGPYAGKHVCDLLGQAAGTDAAWRAVWDQMTEKELEEFYTICGQHVRLRLGKLKPDR